MVPSGDRFFQPSYRLSVLSCVDATLLLMLLEVLVRVCILASKCRPGLKRRRHLGVTSGACKLSNESKPLLGLALGTGDSTEHPFLVTHSCLCVD